MKSLEGYWGVIGVLGRRRNLLKVNSLGLMIMQLPLSLEAGSAEIGALGGDFRGMMGRIESRSL